jgi:hypothetical protein
LASELVAREAEDLEIIAWELVRERAVRGDSELGV